MDCAARMNDLFGWSDGRVLIFVDHVEHVWVVARGWRRGDRLSDVRRWTFDSERRATGQLRRLVEEATGDTAAAAAASSDLAAWFATRSPSG